MSAGRAAADGRHSPLTVTGRERLGWNGQKERGQDDKWSMRAAEGRCYGNKEAASFSWLHTGDATPAAPAHWRGGSEEDKHEVKTGQNSVPPSCLFKLPLKYFMQTPFMLWKKALVIPTMETRSRAAVIHVKSLIWFIAHFCWRQLSNLFLTVCIFFFTLLLYWKHSWPYLDDQVLHFYGIVNQSLAHRKRRLETPITHV